MSEGGKKKKNGYTFLIVSAKNGKVHEIHFTNDLIIVIAVILLLALTGGIFSFVHYAGQINDERLQIMAWESQCNELTNALAAAVSENNELLAKNQKLEEQISRKDYMEQQSSSVEATKYVPSGLPISGQVSVPSKFSSNIEGVVFSVGEGAKIVAAGNGTVSSVTYDTNYGYVVVIDHGNSFSSYYCYSTNPLVTEGESVSRGQSIFLTSDNNRFTYKISYEGNYVDPNTVLDIDG